MKTVNELLDLSGQVAIVTGGAKGIGQRIAYRLAEAGARVMVADIDEEAAEHAAQELVARGWDAGSFAVDVANEAQIKIMVHSCVSHYGGLDILVNNAGIYSPTPVAEMSPEQFDKVMAVNLRSVFLTTKYATEFMKNHGGGRIINITSIDAIHPSMVGLAHYDAAKHGVWGFTKNSALELAPHKIWVNAIAPGGIQTPGVAAIQGGGPVNPKVMKSFLAKIPMGRLGLADEIGLVALFLASDMSSYMTGEQIVVDGGALLS